MRFHSDSPPLVKSCQAGHARLAIGVAKVSVTRLIGTAKVASKGERELGRKVLSNSKAKHKKLFPSSSEAELERLPVMSPISRPEKEFTVPVLPPMLHAYG